MDGEILKSFFFFFVRFRFCSAQHKAANKSVSKWNEDGFIKLLSDGHVEHGMPDWSVW